MPALLMSPPNGDQQKSVTKISLNERKRIFRQIIVKCVLQLLLIETTNDLLRNDDVYNTIPPEHLLKLMGVLDHSYQFARSFNEDKELRTGLWKVGGCLHLHRNCCLRSSVICRFYEAPPESFEARVQQCFHSNTCTPPHVLRSST